MVFIGYTTYDIYITNKNSYYFYLSLKYENDIVNDLIAKNPDCIHIYNYGWNFNQMTALTFEFQHSNYLHAKMMELFPNTYYFNFLFYPERFSNWFTEVDIHQVLKKNNNKALIIGAQILDVHQQSLIKNHLKIEPIHISPNPYVYNSLYYLKEDGGL